MGRSLCMSSCVCASTGSMCVSRHVFTIEPMICEGTSKHVEWRVYWQRVVFVTLIATFNTCLALVEWVLHSRVQKRQTINPRPLFVLGHPRTGTTHLHNLLSLDREHFAFCSTFHCGFPAALASTSVTQPRLPRSWPSCLRG